RDHRGVVSRVSSERRTADHEIWGRCVRLVEDARRHARAGRPRPTVDLARGRHGSLHTVAARAAGMIAVALGIAYIALLLAKAALAVRAAGRSPRPALGDAIDFSDVVVAQPILSGDPRLSETLEDNVLALPSAHFVWLVDSDDPEAQAICATLCARHSAARIETMVSPPPPDGCNPKLFKLERARAI